MDIKAVLKANQGTIVDVRCTDEYEVEHIKDAINIPLGAITFELDKVKELERPLIVCCASGKRSQLAFDMLNSEGVETLNGGSWDELKALLASL